MKTLYIAGFGRSGSTLLDNLLGGVEGFFSAGELCYTWAQNLPHTGLCGCGKTPRRCEVWGQVFASDSVGNIDVREMARLESHALRTRHLPLMLAPHGEAILQRSLDGYLKNLGMFYEEIQHVTGARVIVDSSKTPAYGWALERTPGVEMYVVHLVRDPRATAYSWLKKKHQPDRGEAGYMDQHPPAKSSALWTSWNATAERLWGRSDRYLRLRYEDFVADPRATLQRILTLVDERDAEPPFIEGREVELGTTHTIAGNPNRFASGKTELRLDDEWMHRMGRRDRALVTALTLPLLARYGYLRSGRST